MIVQAISHYVCLYRLSHGSNLNSLYCTGYWIEFAARFVFLGENVTLEEIVELPCSIVCMIVQSMGVEAVGRAKNHHVSQRSCIAGWFVCL